MNDKLDLDRVWLQIQNQKNGGYYEFLKYKHLVTVTLYSQQYFKLTASNGAEFWLDMPKSWGHVSDVINYIEEQIEEQIEDDEHTYIFINLYAGSDQSPQFKASDAYDPNKPFDLDHV